MKKSSIFAVTENGESRYCETDAYGGLAGIAMRFFQNSHDENGNVRPFFDRLDSVVEISEERWKEIEGNPGGTAEDYYSFITINVDTNMICADEDWPGERHYTEIPVDKLLETVASLIEKHRFAGITAVDKYMLYNTIKRRFYRHRDVCFPYAGDSEKQNVKNLSILEQIRSTQPREFHSPRKRGRPPKINRD